MLYIIYDVFPLAYLQGHAEDQELFFLTDDAHVPPKVSRMVNGNEPAEPETSSITTTASATAPTNSGW